jgi:hypothetical protein
MGKIAVHEFITLDGVIDTPSWTVGYPFDPKMGEAIAAIMDKAILLGRPELPGAPSSPVGR